MKTKTQTPKDRLICGCMTTGRKNEVIQCPVHAAAPDLLEALKAILPPNGEKGFGEWWGLSDKEQRERINVVIQNAIGNK